MLHCSYMYLIAEGKSGADSHGILLINNGDGDLYLNISKQQSMKFDDSDAKHYGV